MVQVDPNSEWRQAADVLAACIDFQPTRSWLVILGLAAVPVLVLVLHGLIFGAAGVAGPVVLVIAGLVGAVIVVRAASVRTRRSSELLRTTLFRVAAVVALLTELVAAAFGDRDWLAHRRIGAVLASANPCDFDQATSDLEAFGTDEEKAQVQSRKAACAEQVYNAHCDAVATHLDARSVTADDLAFIASVPSSAAYAKDVVQRLGAGNVSAADLRTSRADLPCGDKIWSRAVKVAAITPTAWSSSPNATSVSISDDMRAALANASLSVDVQHAIQVDEDAVVRPVLEKTKTDDMGQALSLCELGRVLRVTPTASCVAIGERYRQTKAREDAVAAAATAREESVQRATAEHQDAVEKAKNARCQAIRDHVERCQKTCEIRFPFNGEPERDEAEQGCESRCEDNAPNCE
jgi:hypothetical protein